MQLPAGLRRVDAVLATVLALFCFFFFQHPDLIAVASSAGFLYEGHFHDFYETVASRMPESNYLPSTYWVFALWALPLRLLGVFPSGLDLGWSLFWFKLLPCLVYLTSAYLVHEIGIQITGGDKKAARAMAVIWALSPIAFFSQFIFGQYDIFTTALLLLALNEVLKGRLLRASGIIGVSLTFKYFPVFAYFPLLLMLEKKPKRLALHGLLLALPVFLETRVYNHSAVFRHGVYEFPAAQRVFSATIGGSSLIFLIWFTVCAWAYMHKPLSRAELSRWVVYIPFACLSLVFGLVTWHPQWLIALTPFLTILAVMHPKRDFLLFLELVATVALVFILVHLFTGNVDQSLLRQGVLALFSAEFFVRHPGVSMSKILRGYPLEPAFLYAQFSAVLLSFILFCRPALPAAFASGVPSTLVLRVRFFGGVLLFVIPALITIWVQPR